MSNILIIGNSPASVSAVEYIRQHNKEAAITLMSPQQCMPYNRALLPSLIAKDIKESAVYVANDKFFKDNQVNFIHQEAITRLSTKRHQISTESKTHVLYDQLLLTDVSTVRLPAIKGHHRKGVFDVLRLPSVKEIIKFIPFMDTAVIPAG